MILNSGFQRRYIMVLMGLVPLGFCCMLGGSALAQSGSVNPTRVVLSPEAAAEAEQRKTMRVAQLRKEARQLYKNGRYAEAIERYEAAYEVIPDIELIYSIGVSYQQLRLWRRCIEAFDRYLKDAPLTHKRDRAVNARESCEARTEVRQVLTVKTTPLGASVYVGDRNEPMVGQSPVSITLPAGSHRVWVELDGYTPEMKKIEIQRSQPFDLDLRLNRLPGKGQVFVDSNIIDAQVYLNGERLQFTPFTEALAIDPGRYQLVVERDGYGRFKEQIKVESDALTRIPVALSPTKSHRTWRTYSGWAALVAGLGSVGFGFVAQDEADGLFNDTARFDDLRNREVLSHVVGGLLMAIGTGLLTWDVVDRSIPSDHLNPAYKGPTARIQHSAGSSLRASP